MGKRAKQGHLVPLDHLVPLVFKETGVSLDLKDHQGSLGLWVSQDLLDQKDLMVSLGQRGSRAMLGHRVLMENPVHRAHRGCLVRRVLVGKQE